MFPKTVVYVYLKTTGLMPGLGEGDLSRTAVRCLRVAPGNLWA